MHGRGLIPHVCAISVSVTKSTVAMLVSVLFLPLQVTVYCRWYILPFHEHVFETCGGSFYSCWANIFFYTHYTIRPFQYGILNQTSRHCISCNEIIITTQFWGFSISWSTRFWRIFFHFNAKWILCIPSNGAVTLTDVS